MKKEWKNPELTLLDSKETNETECTCDIGGGIVKKADKHPCHKTGNGQHNDNGNHGDGVDQNGHVISVGCTDLSHYVDGVCICCCYKPFNGGVQPQS